MNHIEMNEDSSQYGLLHTFSYAKVSAGVAFVAVMVMITSTIVAQGSLPGSPLYSVKRAFEGASTVVVPGQGIEITFVERRVEEASKLAISNLEEDEVDVVLQTLEGYRQDIAQVRESDASKDSVETIESIKDNARVLTVAITNTDSGTFLENLRGLIAERVLGCADEDLAAEVNELLASGDIASVIEASELSARCSE